MIYIYFTQKHLQSSCSIPYVMIEHKNPGWHFTKEFMKFDYHIQIWSHAVKQKMVSRSKEPAK
jgi:hypothetical protein